MRTPAQILRLATFGAACLLLTGCVTGERPTLTSEPQSTDAAAEAVSRLLSTTTDDLTASYLITPSTPGVSSREAIVMQSGDRTRVTIGEVDFFIDGADQRTCIGVMSECFDGLLDGYVSDLNVTHAFYRDAFAQRLQTDSERRIGPSTGYETEVAGVTSTCVDVQVVGGTVAYCASELGVLTRYGGADTSIELVAAESSVDELALSPDASN